MGVSEIRVLGSKVCLVWVGILMRVITLCNLNQKQTGSLVIARRGSIKKNVTLHKMPTIVISKFFLSKLPLDTVFFLNEVSLVY